MFYPVRVLNPDLKLKKTISSKELSRLHWGKFNRLEGKNKRLTPGYKLSMKERRELAEKALEMAIQNNN